MAKFKVQLYFTIYEEFGYLNSGKIENKTELFKKFNKIWQDWLIGYEWMKILNSVPVLEESKY